MQIKKLLLGRGFTPQAAFDQLFFLGPVNFKFHLRVLVVRCLNEPMGCVAEFKLFFDMKVVFFHKKSLPDLKIRFREAIHCFL
jgi:hypothetical protein